MPGRKSKCRYKKTSQLEIECYGRQHVIELERPRLEMSAGRFECGSKPSSCMKSVAMVVPPYLIRPTV